MFYALALGIWAAALGQPDDDPSARELLARIETRHRGARDLAAGFVQTYRSGVLGRQIVERGRLSVKRPGRMRWEYEAPEEKLFVADGESFFFYVPADRQVIVRPQAGERGIAIALLSGDGSLSLEFESFLDAPNRLLLVPRAPDPEVQRVYVDVDVDARILAIEVLDVQSSRTRYEFDDLRENVGLSDTLFRFEVPAGVEVIEG